MTEYQVYKLFNADGDLLYVGISKNTFARIAAHLRKPWGKEVARQEISPAMTRDDALRTEADEIKSLKPKYNIRHNARRDAEWKPGVFHPYQLMAAMHILGWDAEETASQCGVSVEDIEGYISCKDMTKYEPIFCGLEEAGIEILCWSAYPDPENVDVGINMNLVFGKESLPDCSRFDEQRECIRIDEAAAKRKHLGLKA